MIEKKYTCDFCGAVLTREVTVYMSVVVGDGSIEKGVSVSGEYCEKCRGNGNHITSLAKKANRAQGRTA